MSAMIDLADGPYRYRHGWIKITDSAAADQDGKDVAGHLGEGKGVVVGKYNHNLGTVTDAKGARHKVVAVNGERNEAGFKGQVATSHLPADLKAGIMGYDAMVKGGMQRNARGTRVSKKNAAPTGLSGTGYDAIGLAQPKLGSGARFKKLSGQLAARGAHNPDALAAYIGRKKYGAKKFGGLSHHQHANGLAGILLADTGYDNSQMKCPSCGYQSDSARFAISGGASGVSDAASGSLRTPAGGNVASSGMNATQGISVRGGSPSGALSNTGQRAIGLAGEQLHPRLAITGPYDFMVSRSAEDPATAVVRHRRGGDVIGEIEHLPDGSWAGKLDGRRLESHTQQRAALMELLGTHNRTVTGHAPLQPRPAQTPLMAQYGIPAIRALATPDNGSSDGPRVTTSGGGSDSDGDSDGSGSLTPKGKAIYKKLLARGFPAARAMAFAKRAQSFGGGGKAA
jgi:hypothetical protein